MAQTAQHVIRDLRGMLSGRAHNIVEARSVAEAQATVLLDALELTEPPVDVGRIALLPKVKVDLLSDLPSTSSSASSRWQAGWWVIQVSRKIPLQRRRFCLAHEFKHVIDGGMDVSAYTALGGGNPDEHHIRVEQVADYFAACLLMPREWIVRAIRSGAGDIHALALLFTVSPIAMKRRLHDLGLKVEPEVSSLHEPVVRFFQAHPKRITTQGKEEDYGNRTLTSSSATAES